MSAQEEGPYAGYAEPEERPPFAAYATFALVFNGALAGAVATAKRSGRDLPERVELQDLALIGAASYKLSRLVAKKKITSFLVDKARGRGLRRAVGELLICPYCLGLWASGAFHVGLLFAPRATRFSASVLSAMTISDFLQIANRVAED